MATSRYLPGHQPGRRQPKRRITEADYDVVDTGYETPCWLWKHGIREDGYGTLVLVNRYRTLPHIASWEQRYGRTQKSRYDAQRDHLCRIRHCINPDHLEVVSQTTNVRRGKGTKLTIDAARAIRSSTASRTTLAHRYGVTTRCIKAVQLRQNWKDV